MTTRRPTAPALLTIAAFVSSCIGILLYLWISFGGTAPLSARGYRFTVEFDQATQLATQSQVEISGVTVGRVVGVGLDRRTGRARAVVEIDKQFAPRPADTQAILRQKTLLGEAYVELTPGTWSGPKLPDGGTLPYAQVAPSVQLDQIFSTFDTTTRRAFETWMQQAGVALTNRGEQFNAAIADLYPFATNVDSVLTVLRRESSATSTLLRDGGQVFAAIAHSPAHLQAFVRNNNSLFAATASRDRYLAASFKAFPAYLAGTRATLARVARFAQTTKPLIDELRPAAVQLNPTLSSLVVFAPELRELMVSLGPLNRASRAGFPALQRFLDETVPFLARLKPYLGGVVPVLNYLGDYRRELAAFFANGTATTQGELGSNVGTGNLHYLRIASPINPELLTPYRTRPSSNRSNPYLAPGGYGRLTQGLQVFGSYLCTGHPLPSPAPSLSSSSTVVSGNTITLAQLLERYYFTSNPAGPPCHAQPPLGGATTRQPQLFPQLRALP